MTIYINYDLNAICKRLLQEQLDKLGLDYFLISLGEVEIKEAITEEKLDELNALLKTCSIEIVQGKRDIMVQKIKEAIIEMIFMEEKMPLKISSYLADKMNCNYAYLSNLFSSETYTSIETFIIMQKTECAKQLLSANELNVTEIGYKLNYSSTGHFSNQFKNVTGLTPTAFQRIISKRRTTNRSE